MSFDWKTYWHERAQQDDINAMARGERTALTDVLQSIAESCRRLEIKPGERCLDVGCSTGAFCLAISPFAREVIGVDFSRAMIQRAAKNFVSAGCDNCSAVVADVRRLPFKPQSFDKINCWSVIQYLKDKNEVLVAIQELYRLLKRKGRLLLGGTPNALVKKAYIEGIWHLSKSEDEKKRIVERNEAAVWYEPDELVSLVAEKLCGHATIFEDEAGAWYPHLHFDLVVRKS